MPTHTRRFFEKKDAGKIVRYRNQIEARKGL